MKELIARCRRRSPSCISAEAAVIVAMMVWSYPGYAEDLPVVRLVPNLPGTTELLPDRRFPAGTSFVVELATPNEAGTTATVEIWPRVEPKNCNDASSSTKQFHRLAMSPEGDGDRRVLRAQVPPLQIDQRFCYRITPAAPLPAFVVDVWGLRLAGAYIAKLTTAKDTREAEKDLRTTVDALKVEMPWITGNTDRFVKHLEAILRKELADRYVQAEEKRVRAVQELENSPPAEAAGRATVIKQATSDRDAASDEVARMVRTSVTAAAANLRILTKLEFQTRAGDVGTAPVGSYVSPDFGVALAIPLAGGAESPWFVPYLGASFYFARIDREIPISELVGNGFLQRFSITAGLSMTAPGIDGRVVDSIMFGKYPLVGVGFRLSPHVNAGLAAFFYLLHDRNPADAGRTFGVAPSLAISIDADVVQYLQKAFGKN